MGYLKQYGLSNTCHGIWCQFVHLLNEVDPYKIQSSFFNMDFDKKIVKKIFNNE